MTNDIIFGKIVRACSNIRFVTVRVYPINGLFVKRNTLFPRYCGTSQVVRTGNYNDTQCHRNTAFTTVSKTASIRYAIRQDFGYWAGSMELHNV